MISRGRILAGKVAVVTRASQGIGDAVARRFAAEGARLVLSEPTADQGDAVRRVAEDIAAGFPGPVR